MAKAHYLTDKDGNKFYPYSHAKATYDSNGTTVEDRLDALDTEIDNVSKEHFSGSYDDLTEKPFDSLGENFINKDGVLELQGDLGINVKVITNEEYLADKDNYDAMDALIYIKDTGEYVGGNTTTAESNQNLLDNGWFQVNSRGQDNYRKGYTLDRWINGYTGLIVKPNDNGIELVTDIGTSALRQYLKTNVGQKYTVTIKFTDGTYLKATAVSKPAGDTTNRYLEGRNNHLLDYVRITEDGILIHVLDSCGISSECIIRAIKLEEGEVSTLEHDKEPNKYLEILKCITSTADPNDDYANKVIAGREEIINPNLLNNGWFNVNSRNATNYGDYVYGVDRWKSFMFSTGCSATITQNGIRFIGNGGNCLIEQYFPKNLFDISKGYTLSYLLSDGTIRSFSKNDVGELNTNGIAISLASQDANNYRVRFWAIGNIDITLRAIKLELGSISTLKYDTAPNPAEELIRCQTSTADPSDTYANKGVLTDDVWVASKTYAVGDYFIHNNILYRTKVQCSNVKPPNATYYEATSVGSEFGNLFSLKNMPFSFMQCSDYYANGTKIYRYGKTIIINFFVKITNVAVESGTQWIPILNLNVNVINTRSVAFTTTGKTVGSRAENGKIYLYPTGINVNDGVYGQLIVQENL